MRKVLLASALAGMALSGCGGETAAPKNNVLDVPADDRTKIEGILKQYGINKTVAAMRDNGDHWQVSVQDPPSTDDKSADGKPKPGSAVIPDEYKVYKDGRVHKAFDDKPLTKK